MFTFGRRFPKNSHCFFTSQKLNFAFKYRRAVSPSKIKINTFRRSSIQNWHCLSSSRKGPSPVDVASSGNRTVSLRVTHDLHVKAPAVRPTLPHLHSPPPPNRHSTSPPRDVRPLPCTRIMFVAVFVVVFEQLSSFFLRIKIVREADLSDKLFRQVSAVKCVFVCVFPSENSDPRKRSLLFRLFLVRVTYLMSSGRLLQKIMEIFDSVDFLQQQHQQQQQQQQTLEIIGNFASVAEIFEDFARTPSSEQPFLCVLFFHFLFSFPFLFSFVPLAAALSWYSFTRLCAASGFTVLLNSSSIRLRRFSVCACLAVPMSSDTRPRHLDVNLNTSKSSLVLYTLFGTGTCSSISSFSTTSPL